MSCGREEIEEFLFDEKWRINEKLYRYTITTVYFCMTGCVVFGITVRIIWTIGYSAYIVLCEFLEHSYIEFITKIVYTYLLSFDRVLRMH